MNFILCASVLIVGSSADHNACYSHTREFVLKALSLWHYKYRNICHLSHSEGSILAEAQVLWFAHALILPNMPTMPKLPNYSPFWNCKMQQSHLKLCYRIGEHIHSHSGAFLPSPAEIFCVLRLRTTHLFKNISSFCVIVIHPIEQCISS